MQDLTSVTGNVQSLKNTVNELAAAGSTRTDFGLNQAQRVLDGDRQHGLGGAREEAKQAARYVLEKPGPDSVLNVLKMILEL